MKLKLKATDPDLAEVFYKYRQDPETVRYNPLAASDVNALRERLTKSSSDLSEFPTAEAFFWFVEVESKIVGNVTLQNINRMMLTGEVGYMIMPEARGLGVATLAVRELTQRIFDQTPLRKLIAFVHEQNRPSVRVLEKIGFRKEGLLREHYLVNDQPANELIFGLLRHEIINSESAKPGR